AYYYRAGVCDPGDSESAPVEKPVRHALAPLALLFGLGPALVAVPAAAAPPPVQVGAPAAAALPTELTDYVAKPDASFSWKLISKKPKLLGVVYTIELVSQTWHDVKWDHKLL